MYTLGLCDCTVVFKTSIQKIDFASKEERWCVNAVQHCEIIILYVYLQKLDIQKFKCPQKLSFPDKQ